MEWVLSDFRELGGPGKILIPVEDTLDSHPGYLRNLGSQKVPEEKHKH